MMGTFEVPTNQNVGPTSDVATMVEPVGLRKRSPVTRQSKLTMSPVKKLIVSKKNPTTRVPRTAIMSDDESDGSQICEDRESDNESQVEIERLKKQLAKLKADQASRQQSRLKSDDGSPREPIAKGRRADLAEGRSLGTYNGRTDLDTFLVRFETCSRHFGWSESDKIFHLMNALTEFAEPIVKEVGPAGTLENILGLLQIRFGNKLRLDNFHAELKRRKRDPEESLQDFYLDLCRLRTLASGENPDERYPEVYFRNIFVDALGDRELRRAVLIQNPGTMEAAYHVAIRLEQFYAYETPLRDRSCRKQTVRRLDPESPMPMTGRNTDDLARRIEELEGALQSMQMMTGTPMQASYLPIESSFNESIQSPVQNPTSAVTGVQTHGERTSHKTRQVNIPLGRREQSMARNRICCTCNEDGHSCRGCNQPGSQSNNSVSQEPQNCKSRRYRARSGSGLNPPMKVRREAYLEIFMGSRKTLALLDSGCEQSVIGRNLIRKIPLKPTSEKLCTADGTDIPLLGETIVELSVSGFRTSCRVVVTDAITEFILGIEWMKKNQCVWDFGSNSFTIHGYRGNLRCKNAGRPARRIVLQEEVVVPGLHTLDVPVLVTRSSLGHENQNWGMTTKIKHPDLVVANAIYGSSDVQSFCRIINTSDLPKRLKRGSELGKVEPMEIVETENLTNDSRRPGSDEMPLDLRQARTIRTTDEEESDVSDLENFVQTGSPGSEPGPKDFVQEMLDQIDLELTDDQERQVKKLLNENRGVFSTSEFDLGRTNLVQHRIDTGINKPFKQQLRRHPMAYLPVIDEHVDKMLANDICEPSFSPWASNVVLVKKSDGTLRFCIDYRQLNNLTVKDSYPLPRIDTCFDALGGARYFSTLDLRQGYWQVENDPETADKTTFITRKGAFKFKVLPFGLSNAPAVFQRLMNLVMQGLTWEACLVFLDDIIVMSSTFEQHLERLNAVFNRLRSANLKLKPSKCKLFQLKVKFLGSVVSEKGIEPDPDKLTAISEWPVPKNLTEVRSFVGLASYYRRHVEGFSDIAKPLSELTKKNQPFLWGPEQQSAFDKLKYCLTHYPVLAPPLPEGKYIIDTDASDFAMGAVLQQKQHGTVRVIAYASKTFDAAERMYCTTRKELAAVIYALKEFRHYVVGGVPFLLRTDHGALTSLFKTPEPIQQQARYSNFLADYNFEIQHRAGSQHGNSDGRSRRPCGSKKCSRQDCETNRNQTRNEIPTKPVHQKTSRPLRSGNAYQKGDKKSKASEENQKILESNPVPNKLDMKMMDLSWDSIRRSQESDGTLQKIFELLRDPDAPTEVNQFGMGVVNLWNQRKSLKIINGVIHRNYETAEGLILYRQILVPAPLRQKFFYWVHGDPTSGHFGVQKTADKLQRYAYWSGWRKDTELFVRRCDQCCRYRKEPTRPQGLMKNGVGLAPFQKFHIDLTGPHRRSAGGHVYLLTGICCFTK